MIIQSSTTHVSAPIEVVKSFVSDPRNLVELLPADKISQFNANEDQCSFLAQGGIKIVLIIDSINNFDVCYRSGEGSPFPFTLKICLKELSNETEGYVIFDGEIHGFLKLMAEKPLKSLFEGMVHQMNQQF